MKYLNQLTKSEQSTLFKQLLLPSDAKLNSLDIQFTNNKASLTLKYWCTLDNEHEPTYLSDYYEIDDYHIEIFDYATNEPIETRYRQAMLGRFGSQYAIDYLLQNFD